MRYTSTDRLERDDIPLWSFHVQRLQQAHAHFVERDGAAAWGRWPGEEVIWSTVKDRLESTPNGDYRVRLLLHPEGKIEVQALPAPGDAGPFQLLPSKDKGNGRPLMLDPQNSAINSGTSSELDCRLYKTTDRRIYDEATARIPETTPRPEILLHSDGILLETATSNIAIQSPEGKWLTPRLDSRRAPFLDGVMRRYLLQKGNIEEANLSIDDFERAARDGRRVIGFNGLRGVWEAHCS